MTLVGDFYEKMPEDWEVWQEVMFADANTILTYNANMRQLVVDKLSGCEMVVFNRVDPKMDILPLQAGQGHQPPGGDCIRPHRRHDGI